MALRLLRSKGWASLSIANGGCASASSLARNLMSAAGLNKFGIEDDGPMRQHRSQRRRLPSTAITLPENGSDMDLSPSI